MKISNNIVYINGCKRINPSERETKFMDSDGAEIMIDNATIVRLYEVLKYDYERKSGNFDEYCKKMNIVKNYWRIF